MHHAGQPSVTGISFSHDGRQIASINIQGEVFLWQPKLSKLLHPKVLRQLVIFAAAGGLEVAPHTPIEPRFDRCATRPPNSGGLVAV